MKQARLAVVLLAVLVRVAFGLVFLPHPLGAIGALDTDAYRDLAAALRAGSGAGALLDYLNPPYGFLLAPFVTFDRTYAQAAVAAVQIAMEAATVLLLFEVGRRSFSLAAAVAASATYALYGAAIFYSAVELPVTMSVFALMLSVAAAMHAIARPPAWMLAAGAALGFLALVRPNAIVLVPVWLVWIVARGRRRREDRALVVRRASFYIVGLALMLAPWSLRAGRISPFPINGGINFYIGNSPHANGRYVHIPNVADRPGEQIQTSITEASRRAGRALSEREASSFWFREGLAWMAREPAAALKLNARKLAMFFRAEEPSLNVSYDFARARLGLLGLTLPMFVILPLALYGMAAIVVARDTRRDPDAWLPVALVLVYGVSVAAFFLADRYRMPVAPLLALLAAQGLVSAARAVRARRLVAPLAGLAVAAAAVGYPFGTFRYDDDATSHVKLSDVYCGRGQLDLALRECEAAARLAPSSPDVMFCFANAYYFRRDYFRAEMALRATLESLSHSHGDVPARRNLVWLYRELELFADARRESADDEQRAGVEKAFAEFRARVGDLAAHARAQYAQGRRQQQEGRLFEARYSYKRALAAEPEMPDACAAVAEVAAALGLPDDSCVR